MGTIQNAIKALFTSNRSSVPRLPVLDSSGEPYGYITMSNFAQVLDNYYFGNSAINIASGADLNDYTIAGAYYVSGSTAAAGITNTPWTGSGYMLWVFKAYGGSSYICQIGISHLAIKVRFKSSSSWGSWKTVSMT